MGGGPPVALGPPQVGRRSPRAGRPAASAGAVTRGSSWASCGREETGLRHPAFTGRVPANWFSASSTADKKSSSSNSSSTANSFCRLHAMATASRLRPRLGRTDPDSRGRRGFGLGPRGRVRFLATVSLGRGRREASRKPRWRPKEGGREAGVWLPRPRSKPPPLSVSALLKGRTYFFPADTKALHRGLPPQP